MIVEQPDMTTQPAVPPAVAYPDMRLEQSGGVKLRGQRSPQRRPARIARYCQHQGGREQGLSGRVNGSELSINVVNHNEPKVLTGLDQKVREQAGELSALRLVDVASPAKRQGLTRSVRRIKQGKPVRLHAGCAMIGLQGQRAARRADGRAGRGCPRKRMPSCNRRDRGLCPTRKGS